MDLRNKVVLITGASMGIGLATARRLSAEGARVVLSARSVDRLNALAAELHAAGREALVVAADLRDEAQARKLVEAAWGWHDRLDVLVNNAGQAAAGTVATFRIEDLRQILDLNVIAPVAAIQAVVPKMRAAGGGVIVNVSSMVTKMTLPGLAAYAATKAALNMLSATARVELAGDNIRVLTVFPRMTATDFGKNSLGDPAVRARQRNAAPSNVVVDSADHVAGRIVQAVLDETAEQYMD